jgi:hypothetical protein
VAIDKTIQFFVAQYCMVDGGQRTDPGHKTVREQTSDHEGRF